MPVIRKEIAKSMIGDFGLNQKDAAEKLGITPAAVCQYVSKKRGRLKISDELVLKEIKISAENIIENGGESVIPETCRICKIIRSGHQITLFCPSCDK